MVDWDMDKMITLDEALAGKHFIDATAYKKVGPTAYVLAYQHGQKNGVYFGTKQIHCYEFELNCLALRTFVRPPDPRLAGGRNALPPAPVHSPARPQRWADQPPAAVGE